MSIEGKQRVRAVPVAPLLPIALALAAGVVLDRFAEPCGTAAWGRLALGAVVVGLVARRWSWASSAAVLAAFGAIGGGWHHWRWTDVPADDLSRSLCEPDGPRVVWTRGTVREIQGFRPGDGLLDKGTTRAVLDVTGVSDGRAWRPASGRVQLLIGGAHRGLRAGRAVEAVGKLSAVEGPLNPGEFDPRVALRAQGVRLRLTVDAPDAVWPDRAAEARQRRWSWSRWLGAARSWSYARVVAEHDPRVAPLAAALLLGRRDGVDPDVNDAFARTGTTHLLAISGLHLQVLAGVLWLVFRALGLGRNPAFAAVALATIAYALLVGLMPSVVRSAAMTLAVCGAGRLNRAMPKGANLLSLALIETLVLNPAHLFDVGGQLSFLAIAAIFWGVPPALDVVRAVGKRLRLYPDSALDWFEVWHRSWWRRAAGSASGRFVEGVVVSVVVWLAALPLVALRFHIVSPIGVLLNVPLIPLTSAALLASGLALGLSAVWGPLGAPAAWVSSGLLQLIEAIVRWGVAQPWGYRFVPAPSWAWVLAFYGLLGLATAARVCRWPARRWATRVLIGWIVVGLGLGLRSGRRNGLEADVLAVGHGLAVVIQSEDGRTLLYDCGRMHDPSVGRRTIAPALWSRGVRRIDTVILSHSDADHYNGLPDLLDRFAIGVVRVPPGFEGPANPEAVRLMDRVRARGIPIRGIAAGARWEWAGVRFATRHPAADADPSWSDNARSVVLDVEAHGRRLLLTGDLEGPGLAALVEQPSAPVAIFLAPHHGGRTANPPRLYDWAQAAQVVVSQRPHGAGAVDPLAILDAQGTPLFRTWQRGAIRLRWAAEGVAARGFRDRPTARRFVNARLVWRLTGGILGIVLGFLLCGGLAVIEWGAWTLVLPGRRLNARELDELPGEPIAARAPDGVRLAGILHPAAAATAHGRTVLLLHGFAETPSALRRRIEALNRHGWDVAALDTRGHGRSGSGLTTFGGREADDLRAWLDMLAARFGPEFRPAAWGRSMGAAITARAAASDPRLAALVLEAPYADLNATVAIVLKRYRIPCARLFARLMTRRARVLAGVSLTHPRPLDLVGRITAPTLIVHGALDALVSLADARRLADAFGRPVPLIEVASAGHTDIIDKGGAELLDQIADFLDKAVPP